MTVLLSGGTRDDCESPGLSERLGYFKYILLAYRDTPHVVTVFSPFDLLHARKVQGPLEVLRNSWFQKEWLPVDLCEWLTEAKAKLAKMSLIVTEREAEAKALMMSMTVMLRKKLQIR